MEFEWNPAKSRMNRLKHGVSFEQAVAIWDDTHVDVEPIARSLDGEQRNATLGWIGRKVHVAIWTERDSKVRIISVRRARPSEERVFREKIQERE